MKKLLIGFGIFCALALLGGVALNSMAPTPAPKHQRTVAHVPPAQWDGTATRDVGATFQRSNAVITLNSENFTGLNTLSSNLDISLTVNAGANGYAPSWLNRGVFRLSTAQALPVIYQPASMSVTPDGQNYSVLLSYHNLPTSGLTAGYQGSPSEITLSIYAPDGSFSVVILAPAPPVGHQWGEAGTGTPTSGHAPTKAEKRQDTGAKRLVGNRRQSAVNAAASAALRRSGKR